VHTLNRNVVIVNDPRKSGGALRLVLSYLGKARNSSALRLQVYLEVNVK